MGSCWPVIEKVSLEKVADWECVCRKRVPILKTESADLKGLIDFVMLQYGLHNNTQQQSIVLRSRVVYRKSGLQQINEK